MKLILACVIGLLASPALAQGQSCAPRPVALGTLASKYGETRQSIGLTSQGTVVEVFASIETGSWTITVTMPNGITCFVASGQSFERLSEALPQVGDPT